MLPAGVRGQSANWTGALTISPTPSPYVSDWEQVPSTALLALTYTGTGATDFRVRVTLTSLERGQVGVTESPSVTVPGGPTSFLYSVRDAVTEWTTVSRNIAITDAVQKTGQLPEGNYRACARVLIGTAGTVATEACADFSILQPDPPQLLSPQDGETVIATQPFLQWTPVLAPPTVPVSYEVTVVELLGTQVPRAALEANIPVLRTVTNTPFLLYPLDALQLERTKRYAWQVRAVDADGRQLFRDGIASEIWSFAMADELLQPLRKGLELPEAIDLVPGVARLTKLAALKVDRGDLDLGLSGPAVVEFAPALGFAPQQVMLQDLRVGLRGGVFAVLDGRLELAAPAGLLARDVAQLVTLGPLVFDATAGFRATATLKVPGQSAVPLAGSAQLTPGGLVGRLEGTGTVAAPVVRVGRAPVQYAATGARLSLPEGRLEFTGQVMLFEQEVGCPAAGAMEQGVVRLPVFCDPTRGFRPDTTISASLLSFGTVAGALGADFLTDTLGTDLRAPATFSVFGSERQDCTLHFTMVFSRDGIAREDERAACSAGEAVADFGWVRMGLSNLRVDRLEYQPGGTFTWRALVDLQPAVRGIETLGLSTIADVRLDENGVTLPSWGSGSPGASVNGYAEAAGIGIVPRTMGFRGGLMTYRRWLGRLDPGFEWGSKDSWIRLPRIAPANSECLTGTTFEVDTLILRAGALTANLKGNDFGESGCRLYAAENLHALILRVNGQVAVALDSVPHATSLPSVDAVVTHEKLDCGIPILGCIGGPPRAALEGDIRLTQTGRLIGRASAFAESFRNFDLKFAKLELAGGTFTLGIDTTGAQTAIYDGAVKVDFSRVDEKKDTTAKADSTKKDSSLVGQAGSAATSAGSGLLGGASDTARAQARLDWIGSRLLSGRIELKGPFKLEVGFLKFIVASAVLDTTGLTIDGRQRTLVSRSERQLPTGTAKDTTYLSHTDTTGVTFNRVRLDPVTGDVAAGTVTFDGRLALESSPFSSALALGAATIGGAVDSGGTGALNAAGRTASGTNILGFTLVDATAPFDPTSTFGNIRLQLPTTPTLDATGMRINGVAPAQAAFAKSRFDSASVSFENFAMKPAQARVAEGRALFKVRQYPIAYLDAGGWHIALGELVQTVLPDTLFLPDRRTAYIVLRDAQRNLLVEMSETNDGPRIRTKPGTPLRIAVPALQGSRTAAPSAAIAMDLTLQQGTWRPIAGEIIATNAGAAADDFAIPGFPFVLDSLMLRARPDVPVRFTATGRLDLFPGQAPMRLALGVVGDGAIEASVSQPFTGALPLVEGSSAVRFHLDTLRFEASGRIGSDFRWEVRLPGRLGMQDIATQAERTVAAATFRLSPTEAALVDFAATDSLTTLRLPGVDLRLGRARAPTFRWDFARRQFDFELLFDLGLMVPALDSLALPEVRDIRITPRGLVIPAVEVTSFPTQVDATNPFAPSGPGLRVGGFGVRALAYRVSEFRWDWFAGAAPPSLDFGVDLEFSVEDLPSAVEGQAARLVLRALDVGVQGGQLSGRFEPIEIPVPIRTPVADIRGAFGSFRVVDGAAPDVRIGVLADLRLPDLMACDPAQRMLPLVPGADTLFLASNGTIRGSVRNVLPRCPMDLGPFDLTFGTSTVSFGWDAARQRVDVALDAAATLTVPGAAAGQTVSATGRLRLDVDEGRVLDAAIAIDRPFFWAPDPNNPFLRLVVDTASLTRDELAFGATGELRTNEGAGVDVAFENVAFDLNTLRLRSGRVRLTADAAVGFELPDDGSLLFGVYPVSTPRGGAASARLVLPQGAVIDSLGFHVSGTATASLGFNGTEYASLAGAFLDGFTISTAGRIGITRGRIELRNAGNDLIAYADSSGFWPGNVFAVLPVPARLGVPSVETAYLQLRDPADTTRLLVETTFSGQTVRVRTRPNERVTLAIPGLAQQNGTVPQVQAEFDLVLNSRTMRPVSGGLALTAAEGQSLIPLEGLPVAITQLGFAADTGGFRLKAGAHAKLPGPLADIDLDFRDLVITGAGITGTVELGDYSETFDPTRTPIAEATLLGDTLSLAFTGAELTLAPNANIVRISGGIRSSLLRKPDGSGRVIHLAASIDQNGFRGTADISDPETPIPIGMAELRLENGAAPALAVNASAQAFSVVLGGSVRLPSLAPGFSLGVEDLSIGTAGIQVPSISVTAPANTREFELFGARFALRDSTVGTQQVAPAIGVQFDRGIFRFTLSGYVTMLENTTRFIGLRIGTDGQVGLQGADFISKPIVIVDSVARLTRVAIVQNALELRGDVQLPAPFAQGAPQELFVRISPDGTVTGGGRIVILNEPAGLASAQTKLDVGIATFHLRRLDLEVDFASAANTAVSVVADVYIQNKPTNVLQFGKVVGNVVTPGLRISAAGQVTFGGLEMPNPIALDLSPVKLTFTQVTATSTNTGFAVDISGELGLDLSGTGGSLRFRHVGFTSEGEVRVGSAAFDGGTFTVQNTVKIVVGRIAWSDQDTSIYVPVARPPGANGEIVRDSVLVGVSTFVDLGASVDVAGTFSGGVDRVLVYVKSDDATNHFLMENLHVEIPGVIQFSANMSYDEFPDGFDMALSTEGTLMGAYRIGLVGVMGKRGELFRAGLFLRTSVTVPIIPGIVTLTEVGGGLFVNPRASDLAMVKAVAGMNGPASDRIGMPPAGKFAVMLYAGFEVAGTNGVSAAAGRALVTITDQAFQINAMATFFKMNDQLSGDLALQVGWVPAPYVRGMVAVVLDIKKTVAGTASIEFFAGNNLFAVKGNVDLVILSTIQSYAEVIVVPSGFTANLGFRIQREVSVLSVDVGANMRIWYRPSTNDLGAYMRLYGNVTALGITGQIELIGALVVNPAFALYAQGAARVVGIDALSFEAWVKVTDAGFSGGIGKSDELAAVLANAEQIAADLEAEANRILAGIDAAAQQRAATPIAVSEQSLIQAYQNFQRWNPVEVLVFWGTFVAGEGTYGAGLYPLTSTDPYPAWYRGALMDNSAANDTAIVRQRRAEAQQKLALINDRRAAVEERIRALRVELDAAEQVAAYVPPADPVRRYEFGAPVLVSGPPDAKGNPTMIVANPPQFDLDDQAAAAARTAATAAAATTQARAARLRTQIADVEAGLATVLAATTATDPSSFASYARVHSDLVEAIEHQFAADVDFRMRRRTWVQGKLDTLATQRAAVVQQLNDRIDAAVAAARASHPEDRIQRLRVVMTLDTIALHRARLLTSWSADQSILAAYQSEAATHWATVNANVTRLAQDPGDGAAMGFLDIETTWFRTQATNFGLQAWWGVANAGLTAASAGAGTLVQQADAAARPTIRAMRDMHARITAQLDSLNRRQYQLVGTLFDLYDGYLRVYGPADSAASAFAARKAQLAQLLQTPRVVSSTVAVTDFGFLSSVQSTWTGSHPNGVYEYLMQEGADSLFTVGAQGTARRWVYTTDVNGASLPQNQRLLVRGGAGETAQTNTPFTVTFRRGSAANPVASVATPPVDLSAPSIATVGLPGLVNRPDSLGNPVYWAGDPDRVLVSWSATDPESGIQEYTYRVVRNDYMQLTTRSGNAGGLFGGLSVATLRPIAVTELVPWTTAGGRTGLTLAGLGLPGGADLRVEVRARNGAGILGPVGSSAVFRLDLTPPVFPAGTVLTTPPVTGGIAGLTTRSFGTVLPTFTVAGYTEPLVPTCGVTSVMQKGVGTVSVKVWDGKLVAVTPDNAVVGPTVVPGITLTFPQATDDESGIYGYGWRVDTIAPTGPVSTTGWYDLPALMSSFRASSPAMVYGRPLWITFGAINGVGAIGPLTYGPVTFSDNTGPSAPGFCADWTSAGFVAYLTALSTDPESGVRGYQLRVRTAAGALVRDFPAGGAVDWPASQAAVGRAVRIPVAGLAGGSYRVDLRAVNGGGVGGDRTVSGDLTVDVTPPPVPAVQATRQLQVVRVQVNAADDPETHITGFEVAIGSTAQDPLAPKSQTTVYVPYGAYAGVAGANTIMITLPASIATGTPLYAYVRARNGAGVLSTSAIVMVH